MRRLREVREPSDRAEAELARMVKAATPAPRSEARKQLVWRALQATREARADGRPGLRGLVLRPVVVVVTLLLATAAVASAMAGRAWIARRQAASGQPAKVAAVERVAPAAKAAPAIVAPATNVAKAAPAIVAPATISAKVAPAIVAPATISAKAAPAIVAPATNVAKAAPPIVAPATISAKAPIAARTSITPRSPVVTRAPAVPRPSTPSAPSPRPIAPPEDGDAALVARALVALRTDRDPARAQALLDAYLARHRDGALVEEALALAIEAAVAARSPEAERLRATYLDRFPRGRFAASIRASSGL